MRSALSHIAVCFALLLSVMMPACAQAGTRAYDVLEKKITIQFSKVPLGEALDALAAQAGCFFSYSNTMLNTSRIINTTYTSTPLKDVLADLLKNELGRIEAHGNKVLLIAAAAHIYGKAVTPDGEPLPYVTIRIDGTTYGTATNTGGTFDMKVPNGGRHMLVASAIGYETAKQEVDVVAGKTSTVAFTLKEATVKMNEVVVTANRDISTTATRAQTAIRDLPMPVMLVEGRQIEMMGSRRLNEVLQEQTGLALTTDPSGASNSLGLQVQGFDASYTMIMIDGQPLIGRNSVGILDLSRITIANIERIEIVKGTSSALYGSDALAGVVNIITKRQTNGMAHGVAAVRYGTNNTFDATLDAGSTFLKKKLTGAISTNYYRTDGFDADPATPGKTLPREDTNIEEDLTATAMLQNRFGQKTDLQTQYYFTQYTARSSSTDAQTSEVVSENAFKQYFHRFETFANYSATPFWKVTYGLGANADVLQASRYGSQRDMENAFAYLQADYTLKNKLGFLGGLRYDVHSIYGWQLSPRMGVRYTVTSWLTLKGTAGTGFKAPSFQQLYLSFTNPAAGYTVLGASVFEQEVGRMQEAGEIKELYPIAQQVGNLKAERSLSFNGGFMLTPLETVTLEVNTFHNTISNMIFEELVGMKQNSSQLYSYRNIEKAFTRGIETNIKMVIAPGFEISAGHQLLYAKDQGVIDEIKAGTKQVRTPEGRSRMAKTSDYFNLSNRSRHMANIKVFYEYRPWALSASLRANYRGRYGIGDRNYPNNFIDPYDLYAEGYTLLNATVEKRLLKKMLGVQLIADNLTDYRNNLIPNLPGRQFILSLSWRFEKTGS
jgi:outer membrane receptor for ferrienterochelin and colicins